MCDEAVVQKQQASKIILNRQFTPRIIKKISWLDIFRFIRETYQ